MQETLISSFGIALPFNGKRFLQTLVRCRDPLSLGSRTAHLYIATLAFIRQATARYEGSENWNTNRSFILGLQWCINIVSGKGSIVRDTGNPLLRTNPRKEILVLIIDLVGKTPSNDSYVIESALFQGVRC